MSINLATAKAFGITIPRDVRVRATEGDFSSPQQLLHFAAYRGVEDDKSCDVPTGPAQGITETD